MTATAPLLVLGLGNLLLGDDGFGPLAVQELGSCTGLPPGTDVGYGGTTGLALLPLVAAARALVLVDAVALGGDPPGTVHVLTGEHLGDAYAPRLTAHQVGAGDLVAVARLSGRLPRHVALVGVEPAATDTGVGLSPPVARALPGALGTVRSWCWQLHRACG